MKKISALFLCILVFSVILSACNTADTQPTITPMPSGTASPVPTQTEIPTETLMPISVPTQIPLSVEGPWLVFRDTMIGSNDEVYGVNADGTGLSLLLGGYFVGQIAGSPTGDLLAAIVYRTEKLSHKLLLMKLPEGEIVREVPLFSFYETQPESFDDGPTGPKGGIFGDVQWSPDGRYLAFMGAIDGPTSSLYIYDSVDDVVKQLSENEYHAVAPIWSPDGQQIVFQEVVNFHGRSMNGMWVASIEEAEAELLYDSTECYAEHIMGWVGNDRFVADYGGGISRKEICFVDLESGNVQILFPDPFLFGTLDTNSGAVVIYPHSNFPNSTYDLNPGLYLVSPEITTPKLIHTTDYPPLVQWDVKKELFVSEFECETDPGLAMAFDSSGEKTCTPKLRNENFSPNKQFYLDRDEELMVFEANGEKLGAVSDLPCGAIWSPDSKGFFIESDETIFYVFVPDLTLYEVHKSEKGFYDFTWVGAHQD